MLSYKLKTPAATDPVTVAELKSHCRIQHTADDSLLPGIISAATNYYEERTNRQLIHATYQLQLSAFPSGIILLHKTPLSSVVSVKYYDENGTLQTLASSTYLVDTISEPGRIQLAPSKGWPSTQTRVDAVLIEYVSGFGADASSVLQIDKAAIKWIAASWYENRESVSEINLRPVPMQAESVIQQRAIRQLY